MSLTKTERLALKRLRRYIVLERASLQAPERAGVRGYWRQPKERPVRPLAGEDADLDYPGDQWTNDVAESLKVYTESWVLPIIEDLLNESGIHGRRSYTAKFALERIAREERER